MDIVAHSAKFTALSAIHMNLATLWVLADAGLLNPEAINTIETSVTKGLDDLDHASQSDAVQKALLAITAELEALTASPLSFVRSRAEQTWQNKDR